MIATINEMSYFIEDDSNHKRIIEIAKTLKKELLLKPCSFNKFPLGIINTFSKNQGHYFIETYKVGRSNFKLFFEYYYKFDSINNLNHLIVTVIPKNNEIQDLIEEVLNEN